MKKIVGGILTLLLTAACLVGLTTPTWAHTPEVTVECGQATITLTQYNASEENHVVFAVNGTTVVDESFSTRYTKTIPLDKTVDNDWTFSVTAGDDPSEERGWTTRDSGSLPACEQVDEQKPFCSTDITGSVAKWITSNGRESGAECFTEPVVDSTSQCGVVTGSVSSSIVYGDNPYRLVWVEGDTTTLDNIKNFPATFSEDYNNGSVTITYFIVGPEGDWVTGSGLPNYWDRNGATITVNTNCADTPVEASAVASGNHTCEAPATVTLSGEHVTWAIETPWGPAVYPNASGVFYATEDGTATGEPVIGDVTLTAVAKDGYSVDYSTELSFSEPENCDTTPTEPPTTIEPTEPPTVTPEPTEPPTTVEPTPTVTETPAPVVVQRTVVVTQQPTEAPTQTTETLAETGANDSNATLIVLAILAILAGAVILAVKRIRVTK